MDNQILNGNLVTQRGALISSPFFVSNDSDEKTKQSVVDAVTKGVSVAPTNDTNLNLIGNSLADPDNSRDIGLLKPMPDKVLTNMPFVDNTNDSLNRLVKTGVVNPVSILSNNETVTQRKDREAVEWKNKTGFINSSSGTIIESMSGSNTSVVLEFPSYSSTEGSLFLHLNSVISIGMNVARAKIPVTPLGHSTISGFALGTKTVAGTIIKSLIYEDEWSKAITTYTQKSLADKNKTIKDLAGGKFVDKDISGAKYNITQKEFDSVMRDDLVPFNLYTLSFSEYTGMGHKCLMNVLYGCTIISEGQTVSVENLITESITQFVAKSARFGLDPTVDFDIMPNTNTTPTGSSLLRKYKGG